MSTLTRQESSTPPCVHCGGEHEDFAACAQVEQPAVPYGHSMLPNDSHPGPGCSCRECLRAHP